MIGLYIGSSHVASGFGAAGALIVMLVWIYYSSLIFLLGAEFTRAYTEMQGRHAEQGKTDTAAQTRPDEPSPGADLPSAILAMRVDLTRGRIDETCR